MNQHGFNQQILSLPCLPIPRCSRLLLVSSRGLEPRFLLGRSQLPFPLGDGRIWNAQRDLNSYLKFRRFLCFPLHHERIALPRWRDRRELNPHHQYGKLEYSPLYYYPIWRGVPDSSRPLWFGGPPC